VIGLISPITSTPRPQGWGERGQLSFGSVLKLLPCHLAFGAAAHTACKSKHFSTGGVKAPALTGF